MDTKKRWSLTAGGILLLITFFIYVFFDSITPLIVGLGLAYAVSPVVDFMEERGVARSLTTLLFIFVFFTVGGITLFILIPSVVGDLTVFLSDLPRHIPALLEKLIVLTQKLGINIKINKELVLGEVKTYLQKTSISEIFPMFHFIQDTFTNAMSIVVNLIRTLVIPVFFFYFLRDLKKINKSIHELIPKKHVDIFEHYISLYDNVLNGFIRGQIFVALTLALLYSIGLSTVNITFGLVIGILSGLFNIVPYLGVMFGLIASAVLMIIDFQGWLQVLGVFMVFGTVQAIDGLFVTPHLVGNKVGLSPIQTILAIMIGGNFAGITGMLLAIPIFGIGKVTLKELSIQYKNSDYYLDR